MQQIKAGVPFEIGGIACMKCPSCGVTREIERFWRPNIWLFSAANREYVCTHCR